jgi:hypothetical protein
VTLIVELLERITTREAKKGQEHRPLWFYNAVMLELPGIIAGEKRRQKEAHAKRLAEAREIVARGDEAEIAMLREWHPDVWKQVTEGSKGGGGSG